MTHPVPLAFWFLFPSEHDASRAATTLQADGFLVDSQPVDDLGDWRLGAFKHMPLGVAQDLFTSMRVLAFQHDGACLGLEDCSGEELYPPKQPRRRLQR